MLHEQMLAGASRAQDERRRATRVPSPGELTLLWTHDMDMPLRYRLTDASDLGFRIQTKTPLPEGLSGIALRILPRGKVVDRPVTVIWCRPSEEDSDGYEVGLRLA